MGYSNKNPIHINPVNAGKLTAKVGKAGLKSGALTKTISKAKKSGNVKLEREAVFAKNAKKWHHGDGSHADVSSKKEKLAKPPITNLANPIGGY
jgi:hypothetical protein